jgi:putative flavoprotein involved in K+ transport
MVDLHRVEDGPKTRRCERTRYQVIVIGGGQAGLCVGHYLVEAGIDVLILEAAARIGESWRTRWDSLRLFTAAAYAGLPGLPFPGDPNAFPGKDEVADYLEDYARRMRVPVRLATKVDALHRDGHRYVIEAGTTRFEADHVVITTGPYQKARVPSWAGQLDRAIVQIHSNTYKNPTQLPAGDVLVVGAGNTGAELALEAAAVGHRVLLSGRDVGQVPAVLRLANGRLFWFLATRVFTVGTRIGRKIQASLRAGHSSPLVRIRSKEIAAAGIQRVGRVVAARNGRPLTDDGRALDVTSVLWCAGFGLDFSWVHLPIFAPDGYPLHEQGRVTSEPGLYFVGLPFQRSLSSSTLVGVGRDAKLVADWIVVSLTPSAIATQATMTPLRA